MRKRAAGQRLRRGPAQGLKRKPAPPLNGCAATRPVSGSRSQRERTSPRSALTAAVWRATMPPVSRGKAVHRRCGTAPGVWSSARSATPPLRVNGCASMQMQAVTALCGTATRAKTLAPSAGRADHGG